MVKEKDRERKKVCGLVLNDQVGKLVRFSTNFM